VIREWAEELAKPSEFNNGVPSCPYALEALDRGEVKTIVATDLWSEVLHECLQFFTCANKVTIFLDEGYDGEYEDLENACMALNRFFAETNQDLWVLCYLDEMALVFVQRWSELESAAAKLEKLGYYANYDADDYRIHILTRRERKDLDAWYDAW